MVRHSISPVSSPSPAADNPFETPPSSPGLVFYTAPSTPIASPQTEAVPSPSVPRDAGIYIHPPPLAAESQPPASAQHPSPPPAELETIPSPELLATPEFALDFTFEDEGLNTLEKIYLFSRSRATHHRVFISHALPNFLMQITPLEAVEYVLPLLPNLAMDEEEAVKEALAAELPDIIWYYLTHCRLVDTAVDEEQQLLEVADDVTVISVQSFTPILGTLLLSPNSMVSGPARHAVVLLLSRAHEIDVEHCGDFTAYERKIFEREILHQVVIGMGKLDGAVDERDDELSSGSIQENQGVHTARRSSFSANKAASLGNINPYFPVVPPAEQEQNVKNSNEIVNLPSPPLAAPSIKPGNNSVQTAQSPPGDDLYTEDRALGEKKPLSPSSELANYNNYFNGDNEEQAAIGRLSSMSLIAAVAAGSSLDEDIKGIFVKEVARVSQDPVFWVRREASFALGALAKVVPQEIVICSLIPLFESLRADPIWHVRHSSMFALPALLSRLSPAARRSLALNTIIPLARDESSSVRTGVLEALGEIVYTFHEDEDGPPEDLLRLFLGREEDKRAHDKRRSTHGSPKSPLDLFYEDPARPLACAFNYPAVALSLGRTRWDELRPLYVALSQNRSPKVRRTLAASLGDLANIIGPDSARRDLKGVWLDAMRCEEEGDIRMKAIECLASLLDSLDPEGQDEIYTGLEIIWSEGWLRNWRERDGIIRALLKTNSPPKKFEHVHRLIRIALQDDFGGVRDAAIDTIAAFWDRRKTCGQLFDKLAADISELSLSEHHKKRMTFLKCIQTILAKCEDSTLELNNCFSLSDALGRLATDGTEGVRIGVARIIAVLYDRSQQELNPITAQLRETMTRLSKDACQDVRSFMPSLTSAGTPLQLKSRNEARTHEFNIFSRPPTLHYRIEEAQES
ncbi:ARM repeat-containing protein [Coniophora puteana RWD-64-598 SS2]|uniref:ARM repeat-containing protein n=1 Tax=Coniophora puteana (strain RWD-64-598) TaxID=741705 RepID=A0A5M3N0Y5_CONPW|nr:ARM repeat-containing protein [Coniophora puteana RWD-64-598 SS2]EIW85038.1 ARM repeat-containing protein [Coniophora puteana RWD-64-598 SS2]